MRANGGILNGQLSRIISEIGHTDELVISDAGLPIPIEVERVDLALRENVPAFLDVLDAVRNELAVEEIVLAEEIQSRSPKMYDEIIARFPGVQSRLVPHTEFKRRVRDARAVVRSGDFTGYVNIILKAGAMF